MVNNNTTNGVVGSINSLMDYKIDNASFNKTIVGIIDKVISEGQGLYNIKYAGQILKDVRSSNPSIDYKVGQRVLIVLPNGDLNNSNRYISNSVDMKVSSFRNVQDVGAVTYNQLGRNSASLTNNNVTVQNGYFEIEEGVIKFSSYNTFTENLYGGGKNFITIDDSVQSNVKKGNGLIFGCTIRTKFDFDQFGGEYGIEIDISVKQEETGVAATHTYVVGSRQIDGNPYSILSPTPIKIFIDDIDIDTFNGISAVRLFCKDFILQSEKKLVRKDIFISNIFIASGVSLTEKKTSQDAIVVIDASAPINQNGNELSSDKQQLIELKGQLFIKGKKVTKDVKYIWFREDGRILGRDSSVGTYSGYGGVGWDCVNRKKQSVSTNGQSVESKNPALSKYATFYFTTNTKDRVELSIYKDFFINTLYPNATDAEKESLKESFNIKNFKDRNAAIMQREQKVKCVAVYDGNKTANGQYIIWNTNLKNSVEIISSDRNKGENQTIYYLNNGSPDLMCKVIDKNGNEVNTDNLTFLWSIRYNNGKNIKINQTEEFKDYKNRYWNYLGDGTDSQEKWFKPFSNTIQKNTGIQGLEYQASVKDKKTAAALRDTDEYKEAKTNYDNAQKNSFCIQAGYKNFPISSISGSAIITCAVSGKNNYYGSASITLENKIQLADRYSLQINNATQSFKYDSKGNSPVSPAFKNEKNQIEIKPLSFSLIDPSGTPVSANKIIQNNGSVKWLVPNTDTLLTVSYTEKITGDQDQIINNADLPLPAASYNVYTHSKENDLSTFTFGIKNQFNSTYINNDIILYIVLDKNNIFKDITNFTFPKQGDSGTNGTDYHVVIYSTNSSERVYIDNNKNTFDDNDDSDINLKTEVYSNSSPVNGIASTFSILGKNSFIRIEKEGGAISQSIPSSLNISSVSDFNTYIGTNKIVNIVRATTKIGQVNNYAQYPVCYNYIETNTEGISDYRIKIKPKTGFQYVVYASDGTKPNYRDRPFEIEVQKLIKTSNKTNPQYEICTDSNHIQCSWTLLGNLQFKDSNVDHIIGTSCSIKPSNIFSGQDLSSAVRCRVRYRKKITDSYSDVGMLHAPIYMCLNRYENKALNDWDGNSIDLGDKNGGTILAPQVGAGTKINYKSDGSIDSNDNSFTGIVMGIQHTTATPSSTDRNGLFGYHKGARTIFLDAKTGKAEFGKNGSGKIIVDPSLQINDEDAALLYSNSFAKNNGLKNYISDLNKNEITPTSTYGGTKGAGLMINLTTPQIRYGNGKFSVNANGQMLASAGTIGGWVVGEKSLYRTSVSSTIRLRSIPSDSNASTFNTFYSNGGSNGGLFRVTNEGKVYANAGQIAGWAVSSTGLRKDVNNTMSVGMTVPESIASSSIAFHAGNSTATNSLGNGTLRSKPFYVTFGGQLHSKAGQIANWTINDTALSTSSESSSSGSTLKRYIGMGNASSSVVPIESNNSSEGIPSGARFWSYQQTKEGSDLTENKFYVTNTGSVVANAGSIGGWKLGEDTLSASFTTSHKNNQGQTIQDVYQTILKSDGSMRGGSKTSFTWQIDETGKATFYNILAKGGSIGGWTINQNSLTADKVSIDKDGDIQCKQGNTIHWGIYHNGDACFNNIYGNIKSGSTLSGNGVTMGGGSENSVVSPNVDTGIANPDNPDKTLNFGQYVYLKAKELVVDDLFIKNSFSFGQRQVRWATINHLVDIVGSTTSIGGKTVLTGIKYQIQPRYYLVTDTNASGETLPIPITPYSIGDI